MTFHPTGQARAKSLKNSEITFFPRKNYRYFTSTLLAHRALPKCKHGQTTSFRGSNPSQDRNLKRNFCFMCTPAPPLRPQHQVPEPVPSLETHLQSEQVKGRLMGADTSVVKKKHE